MLPNKSDNATKGLLFHAVTVARLATTRQTISS